MNKLGVAAILLSATAFAQAPGASCNKCSANYIPNEEIAQYLKRADGAGVADQQLRAVDIGKANVAVGVVYRGKLDKPGDHTVAEHNQVSEVYHILDGSGTLVTGWDITDLKARPADDRAVVLLNGPGGNGQTVRNGTTHNLKAGDMIVIPAGTGHWFTKIDDHIRYVMVRIDPDKVAPLKSEAQSKADLASGEKGYRDNSAGSASKK
ncbi:MAG: AraC family ligand binding domain-containing protein [Bryobacteraceae bacterium]